MQPHLLHARPWPKPATHSFRSRQRKARPSPGPLSSVCACRLCAFPPAARPHALAHTALAAPTRPSQLLPLACAGRRLCGRFCPADTRPSPGCCRPVPAHLPLPGRQRSAAEPVWRRRLWRWPDRRPFWHCCHPRLSRGERAVKGGQTRLACAGGHAPRHPATVCGPLWWADKLKPRAGASLEQLAQQAAHTHTHTRMRTHKHTCCGVCTEWAEPKNTHAYVSCAACL